MPVTLPPITRRRFLASAGVLAVAPAFARAAAAEADPHRVALLSDPHVGEKPEAMDRDCNMHDRLRQVAAEVAKLDPRPACAVAPREGGLDSFRAHLLEGEGADAGGFQRRAECVERCRSR